MNIECACNAAPKLIFSCSGGADVGALTDLAARKLTRDGCGNMFCLAGVGGRVSGIMKTTEAASRILVIDGCPLDCAKKTLEEAGFANISHLRLSDIGFKKGRSEPNETAILQVAKKAMEQLA